IIAAHLFSPMPELAAPEPLASLVKRMMAKKADERPQPTLQVVALLEGLAGYRPSKPMAVPVSLSEPEGRRTTTFSAAAAELAAASGRPRSWLWLGGVAGLALAATLALSLRGREPVTAALPVHPPTDLGITLTVEELLPPPVA